MFLDKYLNSTYLYLIYDNYDESYINILDENNFNNVYILLKNSGFYFIEDIILNYLELFEIDIRYVELALRDMKEVIGEDYASKIGKNLTLINKIIDLANDYAMKDSDL